DRLEAGAGAGRAGDLAHEALHALAARVGLRLAMPALDVGAYPLEAGVVGPLAPVAVAVAHVHLGRVAVEDGALRLRRQLAPRGVEVEPELLPQRAEQPDEVVAHVRAGPHRDRTLAEGGIGVGDHQLGVDLHPGADAV